jgi:selenocysteine lyase/cysteine desulfurase
MVSIAPLLDIQKIRKEFPVLHQLVNGKPLIYFDNAATNQKPKRVIYALTSYYEGYNANIHRGIHTLAEKATRAYEDTREAMQRFINAAHTEEVIFTSGATESNNIALQGAVYGLLQNNYKPDEIEILTSDIEHTSIAEVAKGLVKRVGVKYTQIQNTLQNFTQHFKSFTDFVSKPYKVVHKYKNYTKLSKPHKY